MLLLETMDNRCTCLALGTKRVLDAGIHKSLNQSEHRWRLLQFRKEFYSSAV